MYYELEKHIFKATEDPKQECEGCIFKDLDCGDFDLIVNGLEKVICTFEKMKFELIDCPREILLAKLNKPKQLEFKDFGTDGKKCNFILLNLLLKTRS